MDKTNGTNNTKLDFIVVENSRKRPCSPPAAWSPVKTGKKAGICVARDAYKCDVDVLKDMLDAFDIESFNCETGSPIKSNVSTETWNKLLLTNHRFKGMLEYIDGQIFVVELPIRQHDSAVTTLAYPLTRLCMEEGRFLAPGGTTRWIGADGIGREPDASFGPNQLKTPCPAGYTLEQYVSVIIEVGYSQPLDGAMGLRVKAQAWLQLYPLVQYVLIVHISENLHLLKAELWDRVTMTATQIVDFSNGQGHVITMDKRCVLGLPPAAAVSPPPLITIDLVGVRYHLMALVD